MAKCGVGCDCGRHTAIRTGPSRETAVKISLALKGRKNGPPSPETRQKISSSLRGRKRSMEFSEACRQRQLGSGKGYYYDGDYKFLTKQHDHPLANGEGMVAEHRKVLFDKIGPGPHLCHWGCGRELDWGGCGGIQADHLDGIKDNNDPKNLVPSCQSCNRIGMRLGKQIRSLHPCERCGVQTINAKYCSRVCANVR